MNFQLPDYWLNRPAYSLDESLRADFDRLLDSTVSERPGGWIEYALEAPKWAFLCYAAEVRGFALHGSLNREIARFEPSQPIDLREFGAQLAVYAAADGIWPMYFAIVDRERHPTTIMNACIHIETPDGMVSPPLYFFSVGSHVIKNWPYTTGAVYLLPAEGFTAEPPMPFGEARVHTAQLASFEPVEPLAKLAIAPEDFPFLQQMRAHDDARLEEFADALMRGLPWPGD